MESFMKDSRVVGDDIFPGIRKMESPLDKTPEMDFHTIAEAQSLIDRREEKDSMLRFSSCWLQYNLYIQTNIVIFGRIQMGVSVISIQI